MSTVNARIASFLEHHRPATPCLVVDLDVVAERYRSICATFPGAQVYYAVKANPAKELVGMLARLGASFDVASRAEIDLCLEAGARPESLSYGNTIKKPDDIAHAHALGVDLFAFDSATELDKLAEFAPGATVFCRLLVASSGADWPLGRKFGCASEMAVDLLQRAAESGLVPGGVSFHVGSQQLQPSRWNRGIAQAARVFTDLERAGIRLRTLNLGGGFPAHYVENFPPLEVYGKTIYDALEQSLGGAEDLSIALEPGRYVVADAGVLRTTVVLTSRKSYRDDKRWVYLDTGRYGGLAETEGEAIRYRVATQHDDGCPVGPVVLAGPTCDSTDVLYEDHVYELPLDLGVGDHVDLLSAGAYTASYSSVGFNGFPPLPTYCIGGRS